VQQRTAEVLDAVITPDITIMQRSTTKTMQCTVGQDAHGSASCKLKGMRLLQGLQECYKDAKGCYVSLHRSVTLAHTCESVTLAHTYKQCWCEHTQPASAAAQQTRHTPVWLPLWVLQAILILCICSGVQLELQPFAHDV
jgi:hypothetical protein